MKTIDAVLLDHKAQPATTLTDLLLVGPLADNSYRGFTLLDRNVDFAPSVSLGTMTFKAPTGFEMSALKSSNDQGVNNAEATTLQPVAGFEADGFTQAQIDAGALDKVRFVVLRVNYEDLTPGRSEIIAGGVIGEVRRKLGGLTVLELRSLSQLLRQTNIIQLTSLTCPAKFGSQPIGTGGGVVEEEFPCGFDLTAEWVTGTITSVGAETDRQFIDTTLAGAGADYYAPGLVEILDGDNAGQQIEVDTYDTTSGVVELRFGTVSPLADGVSYRIRRHCSKNWSGHNSCDTFWGTEKPRHFRGQRALPIGQSANLTVPGAGIPRRGTGSSSGSIG